MSEDVAVIALFIPSADKAGIVDELVAHAKANSCAIYAGIQAGSWSGTEDRLAKACGDAVFKVAHVAPALAIDSDASAYLAALRAWRDDGMPGRNMFFSHSKGAVHRTGAVRSRMLPLLYAGASRLSAAHVGVWSPAACKIEFGVHGYEREPLECLRRFAPALMQKSALPYFTTFTFFAMRCSIVRDFIAEAGDALFDTRIPEYSDRYLFERDFSHIADMAGYVPACGELVPHFRQRCPPPMAEFDAMVAERLSELAAHVSTVPDEPGACIDVAEAAAWNTPVFINSFNRLDTLRATVADLARMGFDMDKVSILDNASTYPPLVEWLSSAPCKVERLGRNIGHKALHRLMADGRISVPGSNYILTDDDLDMSAIPCDLADVLTLALDTFPAFCKAGVGLRLDDIPDSVAKKPDIVAAEAAFWRQRIDFPVEAYSAAIDTTLALYRAGQHPRSPVKAIRVCGAYAARHVPWYYGDSLPDDERWLRSQPRRPTGDWSRRA